MCFPRFRRKDGGSLKVNKSQKNESGHKTCDAFSRDYFQESLEPAHSSLVPCRCAFLNGHRIRKRKCAMLAPPSCSTPPFKQTQTFPLILWKHIFRRSAMTLPSNNIFKTLRDRLFLGVNLLASAFVFYTPCTVNMSSGWQSVMSPLPSWGCAFQLTSTEILPYFCFRNFRQTTTLIWLVTMLWSVRISPVVCRRPQKIQKIPMISLCHFIYLFLPLLLMTVVNGNH